MNTTKTAMLSAAATLLLFFAGPEPAAAAGSSEQLNRLVSWSTTLAEARQRRVPIVILVEQRHCAFCQRLKRDLFRPLANDPAFSERAIFLSVLTDMDAAPLEQDGAEVSGFEFAEQYKANTTPTILFLGPDANEVQKRIVGYVADDHYTDALKQKIEFSIAAAKPVN